MKKFELFPTTVMEFDFTNHPDLSNLRELLKKLSNTSMLRHSLVKNGGSSYNIIQNLHSYSVLFKLKNDFQNSIDYYTKDQKIQPSSLYQSWFNIMDTQGKVEVHNHGGSVISGAFYPLLEENTCNLCFQSPLYSAVNFVPRNDDLDNSSIASTHFQPDFIMPIKQNHLYLFPGWLNHYTEKNKGGRRVVLSFNTKFL